MEQTTLYLNYLPKISDLWIFPPVPSCEVPGSLGEGASVSEAARGCDPHCGESIVQLVPHDGKHAVSPRRTLPGWKVEHELEVATAHHLL